jgi:hypothetical protein
MDKKLSDPKNANTNGWLEFFAGFCCFVGSAWTMFVFTTMAGKVKAIQQKSITILILSISKWVFALLSGAILFTLIGLHACALTNVKAAVNAYYFKDASHYGEQAVYFVRIELYLALGLLTVILVSYTAFILFTFTQIGFVPRKGTYKAVFIQRVYYLVFASISVALFMAMQFVYIFTISYDTGAYWTNDEFLSNTAQIWFQLFGGLFQFGWVLFTLLAISVVKDKNVGESYESDQISSDSGQTHDSKSTFNQSENTEISIKT